MKFSTDILYHRSDRGQSAVEYTLLLGVGIAAFLILSPMIKAGTQAMVKVVADEVGLQQNAEHQGDGGLIESQIKFNLDRQQHKQEWYAGITHSAKTSYNETTATNIQSKSDLGFSEK